MKTISVLMTERDVEDPRLGTGPMVWESVQPGNEGSVFDKAQKLAASGCYGKVWIATVPVSSFVEITAPSKPTEFLRMGFEQRVKECKAEKNAISDMVDSVNKAVKDEYGIDIFGGNVDDNGLSFDRLKHLVDEPKSSYCAAKEYSEWCKAVLDQYFVYPSGCANPSPLSTPESVPTFTVGESERFKYDFSLNHERKKIVIDTEAAVKEFGDLLDERLSAAKSSSHKKPKKRDLIKPPEPIDIPSRNIDCKINCEEVLKAFRKATSACDKFSARFRAAEPPKPKGS